MDILNSREYAHKNKIHERPCVQVDILYIIALACYFVDGGFVDLRMALVYRVGGPDMDRAVSLLGDRKPCVRLTLESTRTLLNAICPREFRSTPEAHVQASF